MNFVFLSGHLSYFMGHLKFPVTGWMSRQLPNLTTSLCFLKANADRAKAKNISLSPSFSLGMGCLIGIHTILCIFSTFAFAPMGPGAIHPYVTYLFIDIFFAFARSALTLTP